MSNSRIFYGLKTRSQHVLGLRSKHGWRWCKTSWKTRVLYTGFTRLTGWWTRVLLVYYTWQCLKHVSNSRIFYVLKTRSQHVLGLRSKHVLGLRSKHVPKHGWRWCKTSWKTRVLYTGFTRLTGVGEHVFYSFITHGNVYGVGTVVQARSQKFAMGGCFGGLGVGVWEQSRRRLGVWEQSPQPPEALGAGPPALENFAFFCKNNFILGLFWLKNKTFKTWLRNWQSKHD